MQWATQQSASNSDVDNYTVTLNRVKCIMREMYY